MKAFYLTDVGKVRDHNEDGVIIVKNSEDNYLMAVADGMGGHSCGEVASSIVITNLAHHFQEDFYKMSKEDAINFVNDSINEVNHKIFKYEDSHPESKGNVRDEATLQQLLVLANMESYNAKVRAIAKTL